MSKCKFKVGDNVTGIKPCDGRQEYVGKTGIVISVLNGEMHTPIEVRWEGKVRFASWWCEEESLRIRLQTPAEMFWREVDNFGEI